MVRPSSKKTLRLLVHEFVTGGGLAGQSIPTSWGREGAAMRRAIVADLSRLPVVSVAYTLDRRFPSEPGSIPIGPGEEPRSFIRAARQADAVLVIAPENDGILARRERRLRDLEIPSLGSSPAAVTLAADKLATARWLRDREVPVIRTTLHSPLRASPRQPTVLKPRRGAGSLETYLVAPGEPWPSVSSSAVAQPFLAGTPMSAAAIVGPGRRVRWIGSATQSVRISRGRFCYLGGSVPGVLPRPLQARLTRALADWPGLAGWIGVDYIWDPATRLATVLEINPRLTTSYLGHRIRIGGPHVAAAWLHAVGLGPAHALAPDPGSPSVHFRADGKIEATA